MIRTLTFAAIVAFGSATCVAAQEETSSGQHHAVYITENGFFPFVTFMTAGDDVNFINETTVSTTVMATREASSDTPEWQTPAIGPDQNYKMTVTSDMVLTFETGFGSAAQGAFTFVEPTASGKTSNMQGEISFDGANIE